MFMSLFPHDGYHPPTSPGGERLRPSLRQLSQPEPHCGRARARTRRVILLIESGDEITH